MFFATIYLAGQVVMVTLGMSEGECKMVKDLIIADIEAGIDDNGMVTLADGKMVEVKDYSVECETTQKNIGDTNG